MSSREHATKTERNADGGNETFRCSRHKLGDELVEAYAGPGQGVQTMKASEWEPFIRTMPHSEYPSASACLCTVGGAFFYFFPVVYKGLQQSLLLLLLGRSTLFSGALSSAERWLPVRL